ncbi:sulfur carrier protein ThiS [Marinifilum sp. N1E240]|uniref:sulfur carrier protein ThiS n=1 Tax=Marinifilum sp. N1E240 TaxID=2608082 RepID=UPI00128DDCB9|nr:sulfur carrier protein ThiS [Marinifilum sp. N1E240]MPQ46682.1 sulfur carrier protein ThiS [Marinifilum sp. N1E240]
MNIFCNGNSITLDDSATLFSLLSVTEYVNQKGIAVAVNNNVVKKQDWKSHQLQENDKVLIVSATKGG